MRKKTKWISLKTILVSYLIASFSILPVATESFAAKSKKEKSTPKSKLGQMEKLQVQLDKHEEAIESRERQIEKLEEKKRRLETRIRLKSPTPEEKLQKPCNTCMTYVKRCGAPDINVEEFPECEKGACKVKALRSDMSCYDVFKNEGCRRYIETGEDTHRLTDCWLVGLENEVVEITQQLEVLKAEKEELSNTSETLQGKYEKLEENCVWCAQAMAQKSLQEDYQELYGEGGIMSFMSGGSFQAQYKPSTFDKVMTAVSVASPLVLGGLSAYFGYKSSQRYADSYQTYANSSQSLGIVPYPPTMGGSSSMGIYGSGASPLMYGIYGGMAALSGLSGLGSGGGGSMGVYVGGSPYGNSYGGMPYGYPYSSVSPVPTVGMNIYGGGGYPYGVPPGMVGGGQYIPGNGYPGVGYPGMGVYGNGAGNGNGLIISGSIGNGMPGMFPYGNVGPGIYGDLSVGQNPYGNGMVPVMVPSVMGPQSTMPGVIGNPYYGNPYGMNMSLGLNSWNPYSNGLISGNGVPGMGAYVNIGNSGYPQGFYGQQSYYPQGYQQGYSQYPGMNNGYYMGGPSVGYNNGLLASLGAVVAPGYNMYGNGMGYPGAYPGNGGYPGGGYNQGAGGPPPLGSGGSGGFYPGSPGMFPPMVNGGGMNSGPMAPGMPMPLPGFPGMPGVGGYPGAYGPGGYANGGFPGAPVPMIGYGNNMGNGMYNPYYMGSYGQSMGQMQGQMGGYYQQMQQTPLYSHEMMAIRQQMNDLQMRYYYMSSQYSSNYGYGYGYGYSGGYPYGWGYGSGGYSCVASTSATPSGPCTTTGTGTNGMPAPGPIGGGGTTTTTDSGRPQSQDHRTY